MSTEKRALKDIKDGKGKFRAEARMEIHSLNERFS